MTISFDDLENDFEGEPTRPSKPGGTEWSNPCPKCQGGGRFISSYGRDLGACFSCKGSGKLTFKTSPQQRAQAKTQRTRRSEGERVANGKAFELLHPDEWAWLIKSAKTGFEFATSLLESVFKWGDLTDGQRAAVQRLIVKDAERSVTRETAQSEAKGIDVSRIQTLFENAARSKLRRPTLRVGELELSLAPPGGKNPGAVYCKRSDGTYLGKIKGGIYSPSFAAQSADIETVRATAADPLGLAVAYGKRTGNCSCCGRPLSNRESIELGIGPVCRERWGI